MNTHFNTMSVLPKNVLHFVFSENGAGVGGQMPISNIGQVSPKFLNCWFRQALFGVCHTSADICRHCCAPVGAEYNF